MRLPRIPGNVRLTLFGRSVLLIAAELLVNAICWMVAGILFGSHSERQSILGLALLAWVRIFNFLPRLCKRKLPVIDYWFKARYVVSFAKIPALI
jgi:hypothetical protein